MSKRFGALDAFANLKFTVKAHAVPSLASNQIVFIVQYFCMTPDSHLVW